MRLFTTIALALLMVSVWGQKKLATHSPEVSLVKGNSAMPKYVQLNSTRLKFTLSAGVNKAELRNINVEALVAGDKETAFDEFQMTGVVRWDARIKYRFDGDHAVVGRVLLQTPYPVYTVTLTIKT